jgi:hypothetical protein
MRSAPSHWSPARASYTCAMPSFQERIYVACVCTYQRPVSFRYNHGTGAPIYAYDYLSSEHNKFFASLFRVIFPIHQSPSISGRMANWEMEATFDPTMPQNSSWTVYFFLRCLKSQAGTFDGLLPQNGISILDAKNLGLFVFHWFRAIDMRSPQGAASFNTSLLAGHLRDWSELPNHPMHHSIWQQAPRALTYWWLSTLSGNCFPLSNIVYSKPVSARRCLHNKPQRADHFR